MVVALISWLQPAELMLRRRCGLPELEGKYYEFLWRAGSSSYWDTQRLSTIMVQLLLETTKMRITVGRYRVLAIELGRNIRGLVMKQVEGLSGEEENDGDCVEFDPLTGEPIDVSGSWNIVWDLQSTNSTKMARLGYAVHIPLTVKELYSSSFRSDTVGFIKGDTSSWILWGTITNLHSEC
jgi:hypothetical protein